MHSSQVNGVSATETIRTIATRIVISRAMRLTATGRRLSRKCAGNRMGRIEAMKRAIMRAGQRAAYSCLRNLGRDHYHFNAALT